MKISHVIANVIAMPFVLKLVTLFLLASPFIAALSVIYGGVTYETGTEAISNYEVSGLELAAIVFLSVLDSSNKCNWLCSQQIY